jgi:hypothetical protein
VLRAVFRICFNRYRDVMTREKYMSHVSLSATRGRERHSVWGRKDEEYAADFELIARRTLDERHFAIFWMHFIQGAGWKMCCQRLGMHRGNFFHAVYRLEQQLGRVFRELQPYGLFPVCDYFHGPAKEVHDCLATPPAVYERTAGAAA